MDVQIVTNGAAADAADSKKSQENFEEDPEGLKVGIHIKNLHKVSRHLKMLLSTNNGKKSAKFISSDNNPMFETDEIVYLVDHSQQQTLEDFG